MDDAMQHYCSDERLGEALEIAGRDDAAGIARIDVLIADHPDDPRLHFLLGSLLAAQARYDEGREAMGRAIEIAPEYEIARFQLGLLELSSGDGAAAEATLEPLADAESEAGLALLAGGLVHLARDELGAAADLLRRGIARNHEHPLVNRDMELIVERIEKGDAEQPAPQSDVSAAQMMLRQDAAKSTKH